MEKTCGNCGHAKVCAVFINSGCCQWSPCADTLEQRYKQLSEVARELWHFIANRRSKIPQSVYILGKTAEQLEELGVEV